MRRIIAALTLAALCGLTGYAQKAGTPDAQLGAIIRQAETDLDFEGAIPRYTKFITENGTNGQLAAKALYHLGVAYEKVSKPAEARTAFERVAKQFSNQKEAPLALAKLGSGVARETTVQIWSSFDNTHLGGFWHPSPDGSYLVGPRRDAVGKNFLELHDLATNADRRLTQNPAGNAHFTPDGRRIVFQWFPSERSQSPEIRTVNVDGTGERTIFRGPLYKSLQVSGVSADGKNAAVGFLGLDNTWQVGLVSLETGKPTILKNNEWRETYVGNFSPDGRWLVYWMQAEKGKSGGGIYALATDASVERPLVLGRAWGSSPVFTPDGSRVVFHSNERSGLQLWSVRVADGRPGAQEIVRAGAELMGFSRDGSLYFSESVANSNVLITDVNPSNWKSLGAPTGISSAYREGELAAPSWSPDGRVLAYQWESFQKPDVTIVLHRLDGTPDQELSMAKSVALRGWSRDGRLLIASGADLKLYDVETGREQLLVGESKFERSIAVDESAVYYYAFDKEAVPPNDSHIVRLMRLDVRTGERRELHHLVAGNAGRLFRLQISPDGRSLGFSFSAPGAGMGTFSQSGVLVPLSGGAPRPLPGFAAWTPDSKAVLFEKSPGDVWVQPIDGGEMSPTGIRFGDTWYLAVAVHPDGRRIATSRTVSGEYIGVIRNPFSKR
jgi:Tol biopolymer transport system component